MTDLDPTHHQLRVGQDLVLDDVEVVVTSRLSPGTSSRVRPALAETDL
jgi:hypothetical protein